MPTDSMVERVARVILRAQRNFDDESGRVAARAAIAAMRKPTQKMIEEGSTQIAYDKAWDNGAEKDAIAVWQEMINAALGDPAKDNPCDT